MLEVRYPTAAPIAVTDSVSLWGTVGTGKGRLRANGVPVAVEPNGTFAAFLAVPAGPKPILELEASKGRTIVRRSVPIQRAVGSFKPPARPRPLAQWVELWRAPSDTADSATQARPVVSRWTPGGTLALSFPLGIRLPADAETPDGFRVRLAPGLSVWVAPTDARSLTSVPRRGLVAIGSPTVELTDGAPTIAVRCAEPVATVVEVVRGLVRWTLYGVRRGSDTSFGGSGAVRRVAMDDDGRGRVTIEATLENSPLGWRTGWRRGVATLEIRPGRPPGGIAGLVVAVDPGHPPLGSVGAGGLREDSLTLAVGLETARRLRELGATPILTRTDPGAVSLDERLARAERAGAHLFVSIHANAPGDGRPPWSVDGTRAYWFQPNAWGLANALHDSVARSLRQPEGGILYSNLAVLRGTWFPAVLVEGVALTVPAREAHLRTRQGVAEYAAGLVAGIQGWAARAR